MRSLNRRTLLTSALVGGGLAARPVDPPVTRVPLSPPPSADPFTLGVASGEPASDGFVLWTRLAPDPLADDGQGGMPRRNVAVEWQVAADEGFGNVLASGSQIAVPEFAHSVHVELSGLPPGREYFYRFRTGSHLSPSGRTRTAPTRYMFGPDITIAVASCSHYENGYFSAYRALADDDPHVVLHLGDYLYEYGENNPPEGAVRSHDGPETRTLADYRRRHAQYKTDPDLQAAHAAAPWIVVFDDHEIGNDWAGRHHGGEPRSDFMRRRAAGMRAYYENLPLRRTAEPGGAHMRLYRRLTWGQLARFHMLDTRQYRHDQACGGGSESSACVERHAPGRRMLGTAQERWLAEGLRTSPAAWNFLGQQVPMLLRDLDPGPDRLVPVDAWDGYTAARNRLLGRLSGIAHKNPVVLSGDAHMHLAGELRVDPEGPESRRASVEFCATSVSSGGDGTPLTPKARIIRSENPALSYIDARRGYLRARLAPHRLEVDHRVLPYVSRPGCRAATEASFAVEYGRPVLHRLRGGNPVPVL